MKRTLFGICLFLLTFTLACGTATPPAEEAQNDETETVVEAEPTVEEADEMADEEESPAVEPTVAEVEAEVEAEAESESAIAAPSSDNESVYSAPGFPAVVFEDAIVERSFDKVKGTDDPLITIIEYGDFQ